MGKGERNLGEEGVEKAQDQENEASSLASPPRKSPTNEGCCRGEEFVSGSNLGLEKAFRSSESYNVDVTVLAFCSTGGEWCRVDGLQILVFS